MLQRTIRSPCRAIVPKELSDIHRWLCIQSRLGLETDEYFPLRVVYKVDHCDILPKTVTVRVQGIFVEGQLGPDGDDGVYVDRVTSSDHANVSTDPNLLSDLPTPYSGYVYRGGMNDSKTFFTKKVATCASSS